MMKHLLAVQQICARLTQVAQVYLQREKHWMSDYTGGAAVLCQLTCGYLNIMQQFGQV